MVKIKYKDKEYNYDHKSIMINGDAYKTIKEYAKSNGMTMIGLVDKLVRENLVETK